MGSREPRVRFGGDRGSNLRALPPTGSAGGLRTATVPPSSPYVRRARRNDNGTTVEITVLTTAQLEVEARRVVRDYPD